MNQEAIKNSGIIYYECPICSNVLYPEFELKGERCTDFGTVDISHSYMEYTFSCIKCNKIFCGIRYRNKKSIEVREDFF